MSNESSEKQDRIAFHVLIAIVLMVYTYITGAIGFVAIAFAGELGWKSMTIAMVIVGVIILGPWALWIRHLIKLWIRRKRNSSDN